MEADKLTTTRAKAPINTPLLSTFFSMYVNDHSISYKFERELRSHHFQKEAQGFLMQNSG